MKKNLLALFIAVPGIAFAADKTPASSAVAVPRPNAAVSAQSATPAAAATAPAAAAVAEKSAETAAHAKPTEAAAAPVKPVEEAAKPQPKPNKDISDKEPKKSGFSLEGYSFGLGAGALGGLSFNLGYRIPYSPDQFWLNRLGFRLDLNTFAPVASIIKRIPDDEVNRWIEDNRVKGGPENGRIEISKDDGIYADDVNFKTRFSGTNFGALVDFYPFSYTWGLGGLRLSTGYYIGNLKMGFDAEAIDISANWPDDVNADIKLNSLPITINSTQFGSQSITLTDITIESPVTPIGTTAVTMPYVSASPLITLNARGPYLGLGWDVGLFYGLKLTFDAGVVFTNPHKLAVPLTIADPSLGKVQINIDGALGSLQSQLETAALAELNRRFDDQCGSMCDNTARELFVTQAMTSIDFIAQVDEAKDALYNQILSECAGACTPMGGNTIEIDGNKALAAIGADSVIQDAKGEVYTQRDKAISDFNKEVKDYGYFPMVKIGLIYRF